MAAKRKSNPVNINISTNQKKKAMVSKLHLIEFFVVAAAVIAAAYFLFGIIGAIFASIAALFKKVSSLTDDLNSGLNSVFDTMNDAGNNAWRGVKDLKGDIKDWKPAVPANPNHLPRGPHHYDYTDSSGVRHSGEIWRPGR